MIVEGRNGQERNRMVSEGKARDWDVANGDCREAHIRRTSRSQVDGKAELSAKHELGRRMFRGLVLCRPIRH